MPHPSADPVVTVDLVAPEQLDLVLGRVVAPFWRSVVAESGASLWWLRYSEPRECLKLRLHAEESQRASLRQRLRDAVAASSIEHPDREPAGSVASAERTSPFRAPPIDEAEDTADDDSVAVTSPSLHFRRYRRHAVSLGPWPFLDDDPCVSALTSGLALASETILSAAAENAGDGIASRRQGVLVTLLADALPALGPKAAAYLRYHRDWLIRAPLLKQNGRQAHGDEMIRRLEHIATQRAPQIAILRSAIEEADANGLFSRALGDLVDEAERCATDAEISVDPFTEERAFPLVFKLFHGWANAIGLSRVDEAFSHHLLLRALEPKANGGGFEIYPFAGELA